MSISYPSGKKTTLVVDKNHQKISKAIFKSENVEKSILNILVKSNPDDVVDASTQIIAAEAKNICKSGCSILQHKEHNDVMTFTWDNFYNELRIQAPNVLKVIFLFISSMLYYGYLELS